MKIADSFGSRAVITQRFARASMLLVILALLTVTILLTVFQYLSLRQSLLEDSRVEAKILAETLSASLLFQDEKAAGDLIVSLRFSPLVLQAHVFNHEQAPVAAYGTGAATATPDFPVRLLPSGEFVDAKIMALLTPIRHRQQTVGYLYIEKSLDQLYSRLGFYLLASLIVIAGAMATSVIVVNRSRRVILRAEKRLHTQAHVDAITGLENRHSFNERLNEAVGRAQRFEKPLAIAVLDLDNFKAVNDALGHHAGDDLLRQMARRLRAALRRGDVICRLGGDEFAVILDSAATADELAIVGDKIIQACAEPYFIEGREFFVTGSVGIAVLPTHADEFEALVRCADTAMYHAKDTGKNHWVLFSDTMNEGLQRRVVLENTLRKAVERGEMELHYQPQFATQSGELIGAEALLRWNSPELGSIPPNEFISLAEGNGAIVGIGEWVLRTALEEARTWQQPGFPALRLAVNVSARQMEEANFSSMVEQALAASGLTGELLELELTESVLMSNVHRQSQILGQIKLLGVQIAIDDFGTGYSSMAYLRRLPLDRLKVDRAFVKDLPEQPNDRAIVASMVALAHSLDLQIIAEGVETEAQRDILRQLEVDELQGYLLGKPMSAAAFRTLLGNRQPNLH